MIIKSVLLRIQLFKHLYLILSVSLLLFHIIQLLPNRIILIHNLRILKLEYAFEFLKNSLDSAFGLLGSYAFYSSHFDLEAVSDSVYLLGELLPFEG